MKEDANQKKSDPRTIQYQWFVFRGHVQKVVEDPCWFEKDTLRSLGIAAVHCEADRLTGVSIHSNGELLRIIFGEPAEFTFMSKGRVLDVGIDPVAHNLGRKCHEYFTCQLNRMLPSNPNTVKKLKNMHL